MPLTWLDADTPFPPLARALREPNGLLAAGADLSPSRLLLAYSKGIFPWYSAGDPILWWSPNPRMVLYPDEFKCSRSLAKRIKNAAFTVKLDSAFTQVVQRCAATPRAGQDGTWIQPEIVAAYTALHELGFAHSVESWQDGELVGGLYGIHLGQMFFGESMFAHRTDASKVALARLVDVLTGMGVELIDCQQATRHLASLGARPIPRQRFAEALTGLIKFPVQPTSWAQCEGYAR